jgi:hypothetical protein
MTRFARPSIRHRRLVHAEQPSLRVPPSIHAALNLPPVRPSANKRRRRIVLRHIRAAGIVLPTTAVGELAERAEEFLTAQRLAKLKVCHQRIVTRKRQRAARKAMRRAAR